MKLRAGVRGYLVGGTLIMVGSIGALMLYCLAMGTTAVHLSTLAILTTSGPLIARIFEGLVRRRQRLRDLDMNCLAADDEVLITRTVPLTMPIAGAIFSYFVIMS